MTGAEGAKREGGRTARSEPRPGPARRRILAAGGVVASGAALSSTGRASRASAAVRAAGRGDRSVAVLGGGVSGLSAAQELAERGYAVTVYEYHDALGGKARSMPVPGSGRGGRGPLPGEHGFRFFPGFYRNLPDTLRRIPYRGSATGVHGNLVAATEELFVRDGGRPDLRLPFRTVLKPPPLQSLLPRKLLDTVVGVLDTSLHLPPTELAYFTNRVLVFLTSCEERRVQQWERLPWWDFIAADRMSRDYQHLLGVGLTRNIVATKAEMASTRTVGRVLQAFVYNILAQGHDGEPDRVLNAPTNEAWIDPWEHHLRRLGVHFVMNTEVQQVLYEAGRIKGVRVRDRAHDTSRTVVADHYLSALPVEHARATWGRALRAADPQLARCDRLRTDWMVGVQFYLRTRTRLVHGHTNHVDSPWALTTIHQAQFWKNRDFAARYGDGQAVDCLSVCVSQWDEPGILYGKPAIRCTRDEVVREVWAQLKAGLNDTGRQTLRDSDIHSWFLDPAVRGLGGPSPTNREQLLVHPTGTLYDRPSHITAVPSFFLAGDYVATDMDLATMEGANESARRAVNALLDADRSPSPRCTVWNLHRPPELQPLQAQDKSRYERGLPHVLDVR
ncbi:hydroxysqualene dehydroxylase (plasmid) [Streptomyces sp. CA-294286]|uniref:hydroxysqualene dehydroxylase n=1 Tax=Streptomyces sp. CA-294286 TaxID=3240070 RepID=UPI003D8E04FB